MELARRGYELIGDYWRLICREAAANKKYIVIGLVVIFVSDQTIKWIRTVQYGKKMNMKGPMPWPLVGNLHQLVIKGFDEFDSSNLAKYGRTCCVYEGSIPLILTSDPKFIKNVMIKDSSVFVNRRSFEKLLFDPFDKFLTALRDDEWKNVRSIITTAFTSGKLKDTMKLVKYVAKNIDQYTEKMAREDKEIDIK